MKNRLLALYLMGVIVGWAMGFNHMKHTYKKITYGDLAFNTTMSLLSWVDVIALTAVEISELKFWKKETNL